MVTIKDISAVLEGQWLQKSSPGHLIKILLVDSRQLQHPESTLFFALKGVRQDGHNFIESLYHAGVRNFIVDHPIGLSPIPEANIFIVGDVLESLQKLASWHRQRFKIPVIGITGSNGKTVIKEWLNQILGTEYHVVKSPKSYNSQIGVPLSVWQLNDQADLAIFEAGISQPEEMKNLEEIIRPEIGIMTNIGSAHAEGFQNPQQKLQEKLKLFVRCRRVICCRDHEEVFDALQKMDISLFTWSFAKDADIQVEIIERLSSKTTIGYKFGLQRGTITIPFSDEASIENAVHCLSVTKLLLPSLVELDRSFEHLLPIAMRLEALDGINGCLIINDVYNADLESLSVALAFANFQSHRLNKTIILSDLLQQAREKDLYQRVAQQLHQHGFTRLMAVGSQIGQIKPFLGDIQASFFADTASLLKALQRETFFKELILIKGARYFGFEKVTEQLSLKKHQTVLEVNLAALARNLKIFEDCLVDKRVKMMAMVKAAAYGSGGIEIARFLESRHIDYLAVAYLDEGVELRKAGIKTPVMVLNADVNSLDTLVEYCLEPEIFSLHQLGAITKSAGHRQSKLAVHLKLETGMNRLGFESGDVVTLCDMIVQSGSIEVKSIFSHLAASEDPGERAFTLRQIARFENMAQQISTALGYKPIWHIANSNAIVQYPEAQFDMVRIGIGMYGIGMPPHMQLEPVHTLRTFVSQIKNLTEGDTVGYGRKERVENSLKTATIAIGYADGLIRKAGNRRYAVVINGRKAPIVGSICMDMTMVDVTLIENIEIGTEVTVFGKDPTIGDLALAADTIPYEVFTNLSGRVKKIYTYD